MKTSDPETGACSQGPVVMSLECLVNLLGCGMLQALGITIVPTQTGIQAQIAQQTYTCEEHPAEHHYWSLDFLNPDYSGTGRLLLNIVTLRLVSGSNLQATKTMPCTRGYKQTPDPDPSYAE